MRGLSLKRSGAALASAIVLLVIAAAVLLAPLSPYDPNEVDLLSKLEDPSAAHWFGTDNFGRDCFTRVLYGGRVSLSVGLLSMLVSISFGTLYGIVSGSSGRGGRTGSMYARGGRCWMAVPMSFLIIITLNSLSRTRAWRPW